MDSHNAEDRGQKTLLTAKIALTDDEKERMEQLLLQISDLTGFEPKKGDFYSRLFLEGLKSMEQRMKSRQTTHLIK